MKKIFISGAGGYIGSNLATFLSKKNYYLFCLTTKKKIRLKNTKWIVGKMSHNCAKYLKKSDLLILTSKYEGLPNVLLEAITLKKLVISSDCPTGPKEVLQNGKGGI